MLIGYPPPALSSVTLANAAWLTADAGAHLSDGQPARVSRIQTSGTPSLTLTFASAFTPRVIALLGLGGALRAGDVISATTGAGTALGGNAASQPVVALPDGSLAAWIITSGAVATSAIKLMLARTGVLDIGEAVAMPAVEIPHTADWTDAVIDPSDSQRTRGQQVVTQQRRHYRELQANFALARLDEVRGGGLADGMDWQTLQTRLRGAQRTATIMRWLDSAGAIDSQELHRTALYGTAQPGGITHVAGDLYASGTAWIFDEVPPA